MRKNQYVMYFLFLLSCLVGSVPLHGVYNNIFSVTTNGAMSWTGNTLGLNGDDTTTNPGTTGNLGAFITTNLSSTWGTFPPGTTGQWQQSNSTAVLDLPTGSTILHAELIWGGRWNEQGVTLAVLNGTAVNFTTPDNVVHTIAPRLDTAQQQADQNNTTYFYVRSADVTNLVSAIGAGTYAAGNVPATIATSASNSCAGWLLAVVYSNSNLLTSNLNLYVSLEIITDGLPSTAGLVSGFLTPTTGIFSTRVFACALEGDPHLVGDSLLIGPTSSLTLADAVSGSNNPVNNFFCSQINTLLPLTAQVGTGKLIATGSSLLDTRGTFGTTNSSSSGVGVSGARQGFDITSVDASTRFSNGQTQAFFQGTTTGDLYAMIGLGIQIQSAAPIIVAEKQASTTSVGLGSVIDFTITFTNNASIPAQNAIFTDNLPTGLTYNPGSFFINGVPVANPDLSGGVPIGTIAQGAPVVVTFSATVTTLMPSFTNIANITYSFEPFTGGETISTESDTNEVIILGDEIAPPVANDDTATTTANVVYNGTSVLANDTGTGISVSTFTPVSTQGGSVNMQPNGTYVYTPPLNFSGTDTFTYTIADAADQTDSAVVTITVLPLAVNDTGAVAANTPLVSPTSVLANDIGTGLSIMSYANPSTNGGSVALLPTGFYTYTPPLNFSGIDTFNYTIQDAIGNISLATVTITVSNVAQDDVGTTPANTVLDGSTVFTNDVGTGLTLVSYTPVSTQGGSVVMDMTDGTYTYTPPLNFSGIDTFTYTVQDQQGSQDTATVTITVTPVAVNNTGATTANIILNGPSVLLNDVGTGLSVASFSASSLQGGTVSVNTVTGTYVYTPPMNFSGLDTFTYQIQDQAGSLSSATVSITVSPVASGDTAVTPANTTLVGPSVLINDTGTTLTVISFQNPSAQGGTVSMNTNGTYTYIPPTGFSGIDTFTYTAQDSAGQTSQETVTITVTPIANPDFSATPPNTPLNGPSVLINDIGTGLTITAYDTNSVNGGTVVLDTNTGTYVYTPPLNFVGIDSFTYTITDTAGSTAIGTVTISVGELLPPPNFVGRVEKCNFLNRRDLTLIATWGASTSPGVESYRIYFKGALVAEIPASGPYIYQTYLSSVQDAALYQITSFSFGFESAPRSIVIR